MIPQVATREVTRMGVGHGKRMKIASGQEKWIYYLLRTGIYKNKIRSVMREYMVNAQDEHRKYNVQRPIEVTFPTMYESDFKVRDFAGGLLPAVYAPLCPDEKCGGQVVVDDAWGGLCATCGEEGELTGGVFYYFGEFGASNKREDAEAVGFMGIGAKSAFCYTDNFIVTAFYEGKKYIFNLFLDETDEGEVTLMDVSDTSEPNGIEVTVSVKGFDYSNFQREGLDLLKTFKVKPVLHGIAHTFEEVEPILKGRDWRLIGNGTASLAIMGEVAYPIDIKAMQGLEPWEETILNSGVELDFKVGEVSVTTNREDLQMNDLSITAIHAKLTWIRAEMKQTVEDSFKSCLTLVQAKTLYYELVMTGELKGFIREIVPEVTWNGQVISNNVIDLENAGRLLVYTKTSRTIKRSEENDKLKCARNMKVYLDDTDGNELMYRRRANTLLNPIQVNNAQQQTSVVILNVTDAEKLAEYGLIVADLPSFNAIEPTALNRGGGYGRGIDPSKREKHMCKVFELDTDELVGAYTKMNGRRFHKTPGRIKGTGSDFWNTTEVEVDATTELIVPIVRFQPVAKILKNRHLGGEDHGLTRLKNLIVMLREAGIEVPKIYGSKDTATLDTLTEWVETEIDALTDTGIALYQENVSAFPTLYMSVKSLDVNNPARIYHDLRERATSLNTKVIKGKLNLFGLTGRVVNSTHSLREAKEAVYEKYPMLRLILTDCHDADVMLEYVNDMDLLETPAKTQVTQGYGAGVENAARVLQRGTKAA